MALSCIAAALLPRAPASAPAVVSAPKFDKRWDAAPEPAPLKKGDRLPLLAALGPLPVETGAIVLAQAAPEPLPVATKQVVAKPAVAKPAAKKKKESPRQDICRGRGKKWFVKRDGHRSWRCRR